MEVNDEQPISKHVVHREHGCKESQIIDFFAAVGLFFAFEVYDHERGDQQSATCRERGPRGQTGVGGNGRELGHSPQKDNQGDVGEEIVNAHRRASDGVTERRTAAFVCVCANQCTRARACVDLWQASKSVADDAVRKVPAGQSLGTAIASPAQNAPGGQG